MSNCVKAIQAAIMLSCLSDVTIAQVQIQFVETDGTPAKSYTFAHPALKGYPVPPETLPKGNTLFLENHIYVANSESPKPTIFQLPAHFFKFSNTNSSTPSTSKDCSR